MAVRKQRERVRDDRWWGLAKSVCWATSQETPLMADLHLVGNDHALVVVERVDFGNREVAVVQFGQSFLQGGAQIVLQRKLRRRRQDAGVHAIGLAVTFVGQELHLAGRGGL